MADAHKNFAVSLVATAPSPATSGTSLVVTAGEGSRFPAVPFNATIGPANTLLTPTNSEIVRVTAISTDTLTITRAQEGSSARTVVVGDQIAATITAQSLTDIENGAAKGVYGDGSDGAVTFDGSTTILGMVPSSSIYTMTRDIFCTNITVNNGVTVKTAHYRIFCNGTLTNAGTISNDGTAASGTTAGATPASGSLSTTGNSGASGIASGTTTVAGTTTSTLNNGIGGTGGAGGNSNGGGTATITAPTYSLYRSLPWAAWLFQYSFGSGNGMTALVGGNSGSSGGRTTGATATASGAGGGGGGTIVIAARIISNTGTISAKGGNGGNATGGGACVTGGGGGGGGGAIMLIYNSYTNSGTVTVAGGTKGTGLNGASAAADGGTGTIIQLSNI